MRPPGPRAAVDDAHHAGLADAGVDLVDAAQLERFLHARGRVHLLEPEFGVRMQVAAEGRELRVELRDARERAAVGLQAGGSGGAEHQCPLAPPTRRRGSTAKYSRSTTRLMMTKMSAMRHR
jgi:hypothetical protein